MVSEYSIDILIVDDHPLYREGIIKRLNEISFVKSCGEAGNGQEAIDQLECKHFDLITLDIQMPVMDGYKATIFIKKRFPECKIIILTHIDYKSAIIHLLEHGVNAYLLKSTDRAELTLALELVMDGGIYMSAEVHKIWVSFIEGKIEAKSLLISEIVDLSNREVEIIRLICERYSTKQIAEKLFISPTTVSNHRAHIMKKLKTDNFIAVVLYAIRTGIYKLI